MGHWRLLIYNRNNLRNLATAPKIDDRVEYGRECRNNYNTIAIDFL